MGGFSDIGGAVVIFAAMCALSGAIVVGLVWLAVSLL